MNKSNKKWILLCCVIYGGAGIFSFYQLRELIVLKFSNELIEGNIEKIEHNSSGKSSTDWLICSYSYKGQICNKKIFVSSGIPFITSVSKEYPKGKTVFMLNYENDIVFPKNNIDLEIRRRIFPLLLWLFALSISIIIFRK
jgi:hypothetical protein